MSGEFVQNCYGHQDGRQCCPSVANLPHAVSTKVRQPKGFFHLLKPDPNFFFQTNPVLSILKIPSFFLLFLSLHDWRWPETWECCLFLGGFVLSCLARQVILPFHFVTLFPQTTTSVHVHWVNFAKQRLILLSLIRGLLQHYPRAFPALWKHLWVQ